MSDETMALVLDQDAPDLFGRVLIHLEDEGAQNFMDVANEIAHVQQQLFQREVATDGPEWQVVTAATFAAAQGVLQAFGTMLGIPASVVEEVLGPWMHEDSTEVISFLEFGQRLGTAQRKWVNSTLRQTNLLEEMVREALPSDEIPDTLPTEGTPPA